MKADLDQPQTPRHFSGDDLMERGLPLTLPAPQTSGLLVYGRLERTVP